MEHSLLSIVMLQDEFLQTTMKHYRQFYDNLHLELAKNGMANALNNLNMPKINDDRLAVLSIAYHNLGVEFEHLKRVTVWR